jgi:hypothetical protein
MYTRMEAMSTTRGLFKDIQLKFSAMDTNGDGELDYTEFTIAMTGTENGLLIYVYKHIYIFTYIRIYIYIFI